MRVITPALTAELNLTVTRPGYLIYLGLSTPQRLSTLGSVVWNSQTWAANDAKVSGLSQASTAGRSAQVSLGNLDNVFGAMLLNESIADAEVEIYAVYAGAPNDAVLEFSGVGDSCEVGDRVVINLIGQSTQKNFSPRRRISHVTGFNTVLPAGTVISIGGNNYTLERA